MDFSCDRCGKRYSTDVEPVPGRVYRIPCRCGNTMVVQQGAPAERPASPREPPDTTPRVPFPRLATHGAAAAAKPEPGPVPGPPAASDGGVPVADDPFVPPRRGSAELRVLLAHPPQDVTPTQVRPPLARRDPDAPEDASGPFAAPDADDPFGDELRRARARALAFGAGVGVPVGALLALAIVALVSRSAPGAAAADARAAPVPEPLPVAVAAPASAAEPAPATATAKRAAPPAPASTAVPPRRTATPPAPPPSPAADAVAPEGGSAPPDPLELESGAASDAAEGPPAEAPAAREPAVEASPADVDTAREPAAEREAPAAVDRPQDEPPAGDGEPER